MKRLSPDDFVQIKTGENLRVELAYAREDNTLFGERIYRKDARLFLHRDLAQIVSAAAKNIRAKHGLCLVVYDGLRTTEAQEKMLRTKRVRENPHWLKEPRLLSPPGAGGHPRGMAVDIALETLDGDVLDMGTPFDFLAENAAAEHNPAHRLYSGLSAEVKKNRRLLDEAMRSAAAALGLELFPLPQEWWDFRFPPSVYEQYASLSDKDLPPEMRLV